MYKTNKRKKIWAMFLLISFLQSIVLPPVASALTSGPSAPQSSAFEPFATTDMVDLLTGDFTYNLPLMDVPGPEMNFPINLFYHAGIKTNQEASNIGLGWGINPGAISRHVNVFPDDFNREALNGLTYLEEEIYDEGVVNESTIRSLSIPNSPISLTFTDNYNSQTGNSGALGISAYGLVGLTTDSRGYQNFSAGPLSVNYTRGKGTDVTFELNLVNLTAIGLFAANKGGVGLNPTSVSGWNKTISNDRGWTTTRKERGIDFGFFSLKKIYERKWLQKSHDVLPYGALHLDTYYDDLPVTDNQIVMMDVVTDMNSNRIENNTGSTHIAYDNYRVTGNGISGSIKPQVFQNSSLMGKRNKRSFFSQYKAFDGYNFDLNTKTTRAKFRYMGEFASNHEMSSGYIGINSSTPPEYENDTEASAEPTVINSNINSSPSDFTAIPADDPTDGFINRHLKGKKFVEYFTEYELGYNANGTVWSTNRSNAIKNYYHHRPPNFVALSAPSSRDNSKVQAYKITDENGTEHHYGLPVYVTEEMSVNFPRERLMEGEYVEQFNTDLAYYKQEKKSAYAYNWLLTGLTNPDYVDRNNNNITDSGDWGGYVKLSYGNHTQDKTYPFRGPYEEYDFDATLDNKSATSGKKQLFYVNSIQTRTHTAIFFYDTRLDGLGATKNALDEDVDNTSSQITQLRTREIRLFKNEDLQSLITLGNFIDRGIFTTPSSTDQVYDISELTETVRNKSLRAAKFTQSYELCPNTNNSSSGKLTLKEVELLGQNNNAMMPSYQFGYDETNAISNPDYNRSAYDRWGYYKGDVTMINPSYPADRTVCDPDYAQAWSLKSIKTPLGGNLEIDYESDDYSTIGRYKLFDSSSSKNEGIAYFKRSHGHFSSNDITSDRITAPVSGLMESLQETFDNGDFVSLIFKNTTTEQTSGNNSTISSINASTNTVTFTSYPTNSEIIGIIVNTSYPSINPFSCGIDDSYFGGGIRVASIKMKDNSGLIISHQDYNYTFESAHGIPFSSGVTTIEPPAFDLRNGINYTFINDPLANTFGVISPGVQYSKVSIENKDINGNPTGKNVYHFETFDADNHLQFNSEAYATGNSDQSGTINTIEDRTSYIGRPISSKVYNRFDHLISSTDYEYYDTPTNRQGVTKEVSHSIRSSIENVGIPNLLINGFALGPFPLYEYVDWKVIINEKLTYPSVLKKVAVTEGNSVTTTTNHAFDFFTGNATEVITEDAHNIKYKTKAIPAYQKYAEMGSKVDDITNKNILLAPAMTSTYKSDATGSENGLLQASITAWKEDWTYRDLDGGTDYVDVNVSDKWRPYKNYVWKTIASPNGIAIGAPSPTTQHFNWTSNTPNSPNWLLTSETTRYDNYSKAIEEQYIDGTYAATKLGYSNTLPIATVANAKYTEFAYSGAEDLNGNYFGGEVSKGTGTPTNEFDIIHTGQYSLYIDDADSKGFNFKSSDLAPQTCYNISVWVYGNPSSNEKIYVTINDFPFLETDAASAVVLSFGDWHLLEYDFYTSAGGTYEIGVKTGSSGQEYFDDFRFYPIDATMTSYVYDPITQQVTYILDADNIYTHYEYDDTGRLIATYRETKGSGNNGKRLVSKHQYNYQRGVSNAGECGAPCLGN